MKKKTSSSKTQKPDAPGGARMGMNRTGIQMAPKMSGALISEARQRPADPAGDDSAMVQMRIEAIRSREPVGTVPIPAGIKGLASTGAGKLSGVQPEVFIDKLGERLAFERSGVRMYESLITKCEVLGGDLPGGALERLGRFRDDELKHFRRLVDSIESIGGDPTAVTPSADLVGVAGAGLVQVITDPRTGLADSLHAILIAELADRDGWDVLIRLADAMGYEDIAENFRVALGEEQNHLREIRQLFSRLLMTEAKVA